MNQTNIDNRSHEGRNASVTCSHYSAFLWRWLTTASLACSLLLLAAAAPATPTASSADVALAARFHSMAIQALEVRKPSETSLLQCAALLEAAHHADPTEPRYPRLLADVMTQLRNTPAAIDALAAFRKLRPDDHRSQLELIDLYVGQMQTVDQKLAYLSDVLNRTAVPAEVRSIIALRCAALLTEKGDTTGSLQLVEQALSLNPLNLPALIAKFDATVKTASVSQRVALRLAMLRANPDQADQVLALAADLAEAGLVEQAIDWYERPTYGPETALQVGPDYAAQLLLANHVPVARDQLAALLQIAPNHYAIRALRIIAEKHLDQKDPATLDKLKVETRNILVNRLADARKQLGATDATTRPITDGALPVPDLAGDVERFKAAPTDDVRKSYLQTVGELAWFELYFNNSPAAASSLVEHYQRLAEPGNITAARLAGWLYLLQGNRTEEAKVKLSAAADSDPLAAMGLLRTYPADQREKAKQDASALLSKNPSGALAAILWDGLYDLGPKIAPGPDAPAIEKSLKDFPLPWLDIVKQPWRFYSMRCEPVKVSYLYGEPINVRITLNNTSNYDITIGDDGILRPGVWLEVIPQGMFRQAFQGMFVYDRITERLVLKPRQSVSLTVRVDRGDLARFLAAAPKPAIALSGSLRTNVISNNQGIASGAAGYAVNFSRPMERAAFAGTDDSFRRVKDALAGTDGAAKLWAIDILARGIADLLQLKDQPEAPKHVQEFLDMLRTVVNDPQVSVRAWATFQDAAARPEQERDPAVRRMLQDSAWQARFLGLVAIPWLQNLPVDQKQALAKTLANDPDPTVRRMAAAIAEAVIRPPSTQPATAPTTKPATQPQARIP